MLADEAGAPLTADLVLFAEDEFLAELAEVVFASDAEAVGPDEDLDALGWRLERAAWSLLCRRASEDLVQDVWLKLYINNVNERSKPLFFTAIRNLFIDRYRRKKLIAMEQFDENDLIDEKLPEISNSEIEKCLEKLRPEEREVLFLSGVEEYTAEEIAGITMQSRSTVLSLLSRGKKKFINTYNYLYKGSAGNG